MRRHVVAALLLAIIVVPLEHAPTPPSAPVIPKAFTEFGRTRIDNYYWLREGDNPEVISYLNSENAYTKMRMGHTDALQTTLVNEFKRRVAQSSSSRPIWHKGYYYYARFCAGQSYPVYCRKKTSLDAPEEVVLDTEQVAAGSAFCSVKEPLVSPDGQIAAYAVDTVGRGSYSVYFTRIATGKPLKDVLVDVTDNILWADNSVLFYVTRHPLTLRDYRVYRHILNTSPADDVLVYEESRESFDSYIYKSKSGRYVFIESSGMNSDEYRYLDSRCPLGRWKPFTRWQPNREYDVDHWNGYFYIRTNQNATNFRLMRTRDSETEGEHWKELVPHRDDVLLEDFDLSGSGLVVRERKNGLVSLHVIPWRGPQRYISFDQPAYYASSVPCGNRARNSICYVYTSLNTPATVYQYNVRDRTTRLLWRSDLVLPYDADEYNLERFYANAVDGVQIPITITYRKDLHKDGSRPLLIEGYGAYGATIDPTFDPFLVSLLDRGFIYAIAHVRGGQDLGRKWYEDGRLLKKRNSFTDFIACADYLVRKKYADPKRVFAYGASAGGLLVGAATNMRPDLFRGVVADVPWLDVLTTSLDASIPLVTSDYDEVGNPSDAKYYDYIRSYSPYDQIKRQRYPSMLVTAGFQDSQVQYWEPAKWVAKLRATKTDNNMLLLKTDMQAGHDGVSGRDREYKDVAFKYAFLLDLAISQDGPR